MKQPIDKEAATNRVRNARLKLLAKHPFFGDLAFKLPIVIEENLPFPTAATDGKKVYFHPEYAMTKSMDELVFVYAHEIMHCVLMHLVRRGQRDPMKWNVACDVVDNYLLLKNNVGKMPDGLIYMPDIYDKAEGIVERVYDLLPDQPQDPLDMMIELSEAEMKELKAEWRGHIAKAAETAKAAGTMSKDLENFVDQLLTPKVKWQDRFQQFATTTRGRDRTYTTKNRRHAGFDTILPGLAPDETVGEIVFAIDCSGSTDDKMIGQCAGEIITIKDDVRPTKIHILYFDTQVKKHEIVEPDDEVNVKAYGRGGTCFRSIFEYIEANDINPDNVIVATDLECNDYGPEPDYPVLWCVMQGNRSDAQWGEVLVVD